jgi:hypothetical protein
MVIMVIMRVLVKEIPCQATRGWRPILVGLVARCAWVSMVTFHRARLLTVWLFKDPVIMVPARHRRAPGS